MITVNKKINLAQLDIELNKMGLIAAYDENENINKVGLADNNTASMEELISAIENHQAIDEKAETQAKRQAALDKLAALGLDTDDLKALGL